MIIKAVLLVALGIASMTALRHQSGTTSMAMRRVAMLLLLVMGALSVLFPSAVTAAANAVGVGRGADLVLYTLVIVSLFSWISIYRRMQDLEDRLVTLARLCAISSTNAEAQAVAITNTQVPRRVEDPVPGPT